MAQIDKNSNYFKASPALAFALLFYPLIDTLRIFFIRIVIHKTSPFRADRNHIHHRFVKSGFSHVLTTIIIVSINLIIILIAFNLLHLNLNTQIFCMLFYGTVLYLLPFGVNKLLK